MTTDGKRKLTPKSAKLPGRALVDALSIASVLSDLAAPSSKDLIAGQNGETSAGGNFKVKFAAAGYFGLVEKEGGKYKLTDRGASALAGDIQAKRAAVMGTGFGPLIKTFATRQVKDSAIEARLKNDYNATDSSVGKLREVLVESATEAGLISDQKFDASAIESVDANQIGPTPPVNTSKGQASTTRQQAQKDPPLKKDPPSKENPPQDLPPDATPPVQVVIQVDASKLDPAKLAELIRLLRKP